MVEHFLGKEEVTSSSLVNSSEKQASTFGDACFFVYVRELGLVTSKALLIKGGFGRFVNITLWVLQHPRVQASRAAQEKQVSPFGDACFFICARAWARDL